MKDREPQMLSSWVVMTLVANGDETSWADEFRLLWVELRHEMMALMDSVIAEGFRDPILVGNDGRLWDGHHRLAVAHALSIELPVEFAPEEQP